MPIVPWSRPKPYLFDDLPVLTRREADLWSWYSRVVPGRPEWQTWIADIFGHLMAKPSGQRLQLAQTHLVDTQFGEKLLSFGSKQEIFIGREAENEVVLPANAVAHRNTRLFFDQGHAFVEDLGGKLGTYLWDKKLARNEPQVMKDGDQFTVFPYRFRVALETAWDPEDDFCLSQCKVEGLKRSEFSQSSPAGWRAFRIDAHPYREHSLLEVETAFLFGLQALVLAPLGLTKPAGMVPSDDAISEFILLALLERLNRTLKFPLQFSLGRSKRGTSSDSDRGMVLSFAIRAGELGGNLRIFLPLALLELCKSMDRAPSSTYPQGLSWAIPIAAGFVDLTPSEIAQIGIGDILVAERETSMLFPNDFRKGWKLSRDASNSLLFKVDKYFEKGIFVDVGGEVTGSVSKPDIEALPLRLHVILGEKEFNLAEVQSLGPGAIVDLDGAKLDPVRLMINGKILGDGELVEIEGKLAVRVLRWRTTG